MKGENSDSVIEKVSEFFKTLGIIFCKHKPSEDDGWFWYCFQYSITN